MKFTKAMKIAANKNARAEDLNDFYVDLGYDGVLDAASYHVDEQSPASSPERRDRMARQMAEYMRDSGERVARAYIHLFM